MSQSPRITITQTQRLQLNMGLHAAIRMLQADAAGLTRHLEEQAAENPHLRLIPPPAPPPGEWLPRWSRVFQPSEAPEQAGAAPSLIAHVMAHIDQRISGPQGRRIALALVEALEPSGWLGQPLAVVAQALDVTVTAVEEVLHRLQEIEPTGLFARNLAECLTLQAREEGHLDEVMAVVLANLDLLASGDLARLARIARVDEEAIVARFRVIRTLNPKPGTAFDGLSATQVREPDLIARRAASGDWVISLNHSSLPGLQVIETKAGGEALAAAKALQRMVEARNTTLLRVGREILERQVLALSDGPAALRPMTMAEVAEALGLHESTVSRVVAGTSVDTPLGTWWLRMLFSRGLGETTVSAAALRARLARLVAEEPPASPLSDEALAATLTAEGVPVARRTIAKYRDMLGIPPAPRRRRR